MGPLLHSCVEVRELIELSFATENGVGPRIHVQNGGHVTQEERVDFEVACPH